MPDRCTCALFLSMLVLAAGCTTLGIETDPDEIDFGTVGVDTESIQKITLINRGPDASVIIAAVGGPFEAHGPARVDLAQDQAIEVVIRTFPSAPGSYEGVLQVVADDVSYAVPLSVLAVMEGLDRDRDGFAGDEDCDDDDPNIHPEAEELCDGVDNDCDGALSDEELDLDGDGFAGCEGDCDDGNAAIHPDAVEECNGIDDDCDGDLGEVDADSDGVRGCEGDCDDSDAAINPSAEELCDGVDNDCDGQLDEGFDIDGDGFTSCGGDCNDLQGSINPDATEVCDTIDNNCDDEIDEGFDLDADGVTTCAGDCDDGNSAVYPGAEEVCDGLDTDCDGLFDFDESDDDNDGVPVCADDCDDTDPAVFPGAPEVCDGVDNDCDGLLDEGFDADADGATTCGGDCDDSDDTVFPGADEGCDGLDTDCDGAVSPLELDDDSDGQAECAGDCDDGNDQVFDGATEVCNGIDDDCDSHVDEGFDLDSDGYTSCDGDCDDADGSIHPGADEGCDGIDTDCDGSLGADEIDDDSDLQTECDGDCDDGNDQVFDGATEVCNGIDDDCDTSVDEGFDVDGDLFTSCDGDCNDGDDTIYPGADEGCDLIDTDCDGSIPADEVDVDGDLFAPCEGDCDDGDILISPDASEFLCDGVDNDCDGSIDEGAVNEEFITKGERASYGTWRNSNFDGTFGSSVHYDPPGSGTVYTNVVGDFDGDGYLDFMLERYTGDAHIHLYISDCQGSFSQTDLYGTISVLSAGDVWATADLDNDNDLDLIGWDWYDGEGQTWLNDGTGYGWTRLPDTADTPRPFALEFWDPISGPPHSVSVPLYDLDDDGNVDLLECENEGAAGSECVIHTGNGDGTFTEGDDFEVERRINHQAYVDINGDGFADFFGGLDDDGDAGQVWVWYGDVSGTLPSGEGEDLFDVTLDVFPTEPDDIDADLPGRGWMFPYDVDGDGDIDVLVSYMNPHNSQTRVIKVAVNDGSGNFTLSSSRSTTHQFSSFYNNVMDLVGVPVWP